MCANFAVSDALMSRLSMRGASTMSIHSLGNASRPGGSHRRARPAGAARIRARRGILVLVLALAAGLGAAVLALPGTPPARPTWPHVSTPVIRQAGGVHRRDVQIRAPGLHVLIRSSQRFPAPPASSPSYFQSGRVRKRHGYPVTLAPMLAFPFSRTRRSVLPALRQVPAGVLSGATAGWGTALMSRQRQATLRPACCARVTVAASCRGRPGVGSPAARTARAGVAGWRWGGWPTGAPGPAETGPG